MKKKLLTALLVAALAVVPTMTVFAAPENPSVEGETIDILEAYDADGNLIDEDGPQVLRVREILDWQKPAVAEIEKAENLKKLLGDKYSDTLQIIEEYDVYIYDIPEKEEIEWDAPDCEIKFPVTITFSVPGVKADTELYVLHGHDGLTVNEWHVMDIKAIEDGKVTINFTHLSPVVFLTDSTTGDEGTTDGPTSPTSGESNVVLYVALVVVAAATVAVVTRKKMA